MSNNAKGYKNIKYNETLLIKFMAHIPNIYFNLNAFLNYTLQVYKPSKASNSSLSGLSPVGSASCKQ